MLYLKEGVTFKSLKLTSSQRGSVSLEVITIALLAVLSICSIQCLLAAPVHETYVAAADALGGSTEGTKTRPSGIDSFGEP